MTNAPKSVGSNSFAMPTKTGCWNGDLALDCESGAGVSFKTDCAVISAVLDPLARPVA